jgi:flagellar hook-length control protein FliK
MNRPASEAPAAPSIRPAAHVPAAEAPRAVVPAPLAWQVVEAARVVVAEGVTRMEVTLDPPALGAIRVTASTNDDGSVSLQIAADRDDTRSLLIQAIPEIQRLLVDRGVQAASVAVAQSFDAPAERRAPGRRDPEWARERHQSPTGPRPPAAPARRRAGLVDLTV